MKTTPRACAVKLKFRCKIIDHTSNLNDAAQKGKTVVKIYEISVLSLGIRDWKIL